MTDTHTIEIVKDVLAHVLSSKEAYDEHDVPYTIDVEWENDDARALIDRLDALGYEVKRK